jgi:hypothetical protein
MLLVMQLSPPSCHIIALRSKYYLHHPALKHPQSMKKATFWGVTPCGS